MRLASILTVVLAAAALTAWLLWPGAGDAPASARVRDATPVTAATTADGSTIAPTDPSRSAASRQEIGSGAPFASSSEENGVIADAVRDGVTILVLGEDRQPRADARLDVRWRKSWGNYGNDRGVTDADGRFPTTISEPEMIDGITLIDPVHGESYIGEGFLPMASEPRTVLCIAPRLHPLDVRVVDEHGVAITTATVEAECVRLDAVQREFVFEPVSAAVGVNSEGHAVLHVPAGTHEVTAQATGCDAMYARRTEVPPGGRAVTVHLLSTANRHDVAVTVVVAPELEGPVDVEGYSLEVPPLPGLDEAGIEPRQVQFAGRKTGDRTFVVAAPPMPWRCIASVNGIWAHTEVDALATAVTIELRAPPAKPMAKLRCKLLLPDGTPTSGQVAVHTTPELWQGTRYDVTPESPFVSLELLGRVCLSGWQSEFPPVVVGPIELTAGEHEVVLQLVQPRSLRGRVLDENGKPAAVEVRLLRPSGALRSLGDAVPVIPFISVSGDSVHTSEDGVFAFENVGDGEHALYAAPDGVGWPAYAHVQPGDQDVVLRLGDGIDDRVRIQGRVTLSTTGAPVAGAHVVWISPGWTGHCYTDANGRYTSTVLPGALQVTVMAQRCAYFEGEPEPFAAGPYTRDLVLTPSEPLFIRVRDEAGRVPQLDVLAFDGKGREIPFIDHFGNFDSDLKRLDANGRAELGGLPPAPVRLRLQTDNEDFRMDVDVPAAFRRDADFPIVWKPQPKPPDKPK